MNKKFLFSANFISCNNNYNYIPNNNQQQYPPQQPQNIYIIQQKVGYQSFIEYLLAYPLYSFFMLFIFPVFGWIIIYLQYEAQRNK
jgi:hypothetical protein